MSKFVSDMRMIEAIRSGVPSRQFAKLCVPSEATIEGEAYKESPDHRLWVVRGPYGSGKSHRLYMAESHAQSFSWITSVVGSGPGLPLSKPLDFVRVAAGQARVASSNDVAWTSLLEDAREDSLVRWSKWASESASEWVKTWVKLVAGVSAQHRLSAFWHGLGEKMDSNELIEAKRQAGIAKFPKQDTWEDAFSLCEAIGKLGSYLAGMNWLVLIDEVELHMRMSMLQRIRMYEAVGRFDLLTEGKDSCLAFGISTTDALILEGINGKDEGWLLSSVASKVKDEQMVKRGMDAILGAKQIAPLDEAQLSNLQELIWDAYRCVYDCSVTEPWECESGRTMRQTVRLWINTWDSRRHLSEGPKVVDVEPDFGEIVESAGEYSFSEE